MSYSFTICPSTEFTVTVDNHIWNIVNKDGSNEFVDSTNTKRELYYMTSHKDECGNPLIEHKYSPVSHRTKYRSVYMNDINPQIYRRMTTFSIDMVTFYIDISDSITINLTENTGPLVVSKDITIYCVYDKHVVHSCNVLAGTCVRYVELLDAFMKYCAEVSLRKTVNSIKYEYKNVLGSKKLEDDLSVDSNDGRSSWYGIRYNDTINAIKLKDDALRNNKQ